MLLVGQDVELLAAVDAVAVTDEAELFEHVEGPVDGRWDRRRVDRPTGLDEFGPGDVTPRLRQDLDEDAALGRPAEPAVMQTLADLGPPLESQSSAPSRAARSGSRPSIPNKNTRPITTLKVPAMKPMAT